MSALIAHGPARAAVVAEAITWLGTPYHPHARIKGVGVDCLMLLAEVYQAAGIVPHVEPGPYAREWHLHHGDELYLQGLAAHCRRLHAGEAAQPGDIALYRFGRTWSHAAIVIGGGVQVHAYLGLGVIQTRDGEEPLAGREPLHFTPLAWSDAA